MSDDGNNCWQQTLSSLESHVLSLPVPPPDHGEPVAATPHVVGALPQQHVPPPVLVQGAGVALPIPTAPPLNLSSLAAFGNYDLQNNHHAMTLDVQPPLQGHQYGFPAADRVQGFEPTTVVEEHSSVLLPKLLGSLSLYDDNHSMDDDGDDDDSVVDALIKNLEEAAAGNNNNHSSSAMMAEHSMNMIPAVEESLTFVPFLPGQLDCSKCRSVRDVLHESANQKLFFVVHVGDSGTFQHAIIDRAYIDANGQTILNELMYVDLRGRTHECVQNFIANSVEMLKNDTSGHLTDSACSSTSTSLVPNNGMLHIELEMDMLKEILSATSSSNTEGVPQSAGPEEASHQTDKRAEEKTNDDDDTIVVPNAADWPVFSPAILESSQVTVQEDGTMSSSRDANASATTDNEISQLAKQRRRISQLTMKDIASLMHMSKKDAAKELNISVTSLKRLCRKSNTDRWPARKIASLDSKIKKLEQATLRNVGTTGLLAIHEKMEMLKYEKAQVYASVLKVIQENQKQHNDDGAGGGSSG